MKAKYLKPTIEDSMMSASELMITASAGSGEHVVEDGGSTEGNVTEADSRRSIWDDDEDF